MTVNHTPTGIVYIGNEDSKIRCVLIRSNSRLTGFLPMKT